MNGLRELTETLYNLNPAIMLSIAGGIAVIFIALVIYDSKRHNRRPRRPGEQPQRTRIFTNPFKNFRRMYRSVDAEMSRRRRHKTREREREKY